MSNLSTIKNWIETFTGYGSDNVVLEYGNGPEPTGDYASFGFLAGDIELSVPFVQDQTVVDGDMTITHYVQTEVTVPVSIYAYDGAQKIQDLSLSAQSFQGRKLLVDGGLVLVRKGPIINLTTFNDTTADYRFQVDFEFRSSNQWTEEDWEVQRLLFQGYLEPDSGDTLIDSYDLDFTE